MPNCRETISDLSQKRITNFFPVQKGPLIFDCKDVITSEENELISKRYKQNIKNRQKSRNMDNKDDDDDLCVKPELLHEEDIICKRPLSPNIIFRTEIGYTKYLNTDENKSTNDFCESVIYDTSPSKRLKCKADLAVTKSQIPTKNTNKVSRTLQMTQSTSTYFMEIVPNITEDANKIIEDIDIGSILETEVFEDNENLNKINNHISLIEEIIENTTTDQLSMLLFERDKVILKNFLGLTVYQKYFSCKLFTHQVKWYNAVKFAENIHLFVNKVELQQIINTLKEKLIINADYTSEETITLLNLLSLGDVKDIHDKLRLKTKQKNKPNLISAILKYANTQTTVDPTMSLDRKIRQMISRKLDEMVYIKPEFYNAFYKAHLLYTYTNPEFNIPSGLYLRMKEIKYGNIQYPNYTCKNDIIFEDAEEFDSFYKAQSYKNEVLQGLEKKGDVKFETLYNLSKEIYKELTNIIKKVDTNDIKIKPKHLNRFTAGHQYAGALSVLCKQLAAKYHIEAKEWFEMLLSQNYFYQKKRGLWYSQLSIIYNTHLKEPQKAINKLIEGLKDEKVSLVDRSEIVYRGRGYSKRKNISFEELSEQLSFWEGKIPNSEEFPHIEIKALANDSSEAARQGDYKYMNRNGDMSYMHVEDIAIRHYIDEKGFNQGIHCEGSLIILIFYIIFWDIIYSDKVPFTFVCKMQYTPLDLNTPEFYNNRKPDIDNRLQNLKFDWTAEYLKHHVIQTFYLASNSAVTNIPHFIEDGEKLYSVINCIGRVALGDICQRLVENVADYRAGMPDLFMYSGDMCKFVEVKGPGDKLSPKQKLWIKFLLSVGLDAEVCHVSKIGSNRKNKR